MKLKGIISSVIVVLLTLSILKIPISAARAEGAVQSTDELPSRYSMRDEYVVLAQNQDSHGYCWNFAATMAAATTIMKATGEYYDFSELWCAVSYYAMGSFNKMGAGGTYIFQPNVGYKIKDVRINGVSVGPVSSYTFSSLLSDQTLSVEYEKIKYTVSINAGKNGGADKTGTITVEHGDDLKIKITPDSLYGVDSDHTVSVEYEIDMVRVAFASAIGAGITLLALCVALVIKKRRH